MDALFSFVASLLVSAWILAAVTTIGAWIWLTARGLDRAARASTTNQFTDYVHRKCPPE